MLETRRIFEFSLISLAFLVVPQRSFHAAEPIRYQFSFPDLTHRWMQVEAVFSELGAAPLEVRISRSSPGRYSLHDFAKNVYDVRALDGNGRELSTERVDDSGWKIASHADRVTVQYKVYGDRVDGTYLAVDETHAHINMPAVIMWARGLDDRPAALTINPPSGVSWRVATQLHTGSTAYEFTAPNLQYLMDSPLEFGPLTVEAFSVGGRSFRFAAHQTGSAMDVQGLVRDVQKIVQQEGAIFGEFPPYEPGYYTFLADYLPYAAGDGMEHRNSTVMTSSGSIASSRADLLDTVAHEFFHSWNIERIRPRDLEPFDLDRPNMSADLWLGEGFTQYYGPLALQRAGLVSLRTTTAVLADLVNTATLGAGRPLRSAEDMSRMATFTDGSRPIDRTNWSISVISYYSFGAAIAAALDLTLRERSSNQRSLDDFMREMWRRYGKPGGSREGYVDRPYTTSDAEAVLADVAGDRAFARQFFDRYIQGHDVADYQRLLASAGLIVRREHPGAAWLGDMRLGIGNGGARVMSLVAPSWPLYTAGVDQDDEIQRLDGIRVASLDDLNTVLRRHRPGETVPITFVDRTGAPKTANVVLAEDPRLEVAPIESTGGTLSPAQRAFRDSWLGSNAALK